MGFELLYWIPFLEWVRARWQLSPEREVIVSRGGVASWYGRSADRYVDIFELFSADEFRGAVAEEKRKHRRPGAFDERVTEAVIRHRGLGEVDMLHPGLMFRAFAPYWSDEAGYALIDQFTRPRLLPPPVETLRKPLPADYVAVRFYFSECFPATAENRLFARSVVSSIAERTTVVLLNPGVAVDEHADWMPDACDRILSIGDGLTPERNLAVQSAVIARRTRVRRHLRRLLVSRAAVQSARGRVLFEAVVQAASPARRATRLLADRRGRADAARRCPCRPGAGRARRAGDRMRAIVLTSTFRRHLFVANTVAAGCDLAGVWQEEKTFRPERYAQRRW